MRSHAWTLSPLARVFLNTAGWKFPPATGMRPLAHQSNRNSFLPAYGAAPLLVHCFAERLPATSFTPVMSLHPWLLPDKRPSPAPRSQTFRWHRTVLPDNMFGRTPENSNRPSSMLTCPNGPSRQAFAGQSHCRTGTLFYPLSCRIARKQLASAREDIHNRLSRESEVPLTAIHFADISNRLPSTHCNAFRLGAWLSTKHISLTP